MVVSPLPDPPPPMMERSPLTDLNVLLSRWVGGGIEFSYEVDGVRHFVNPAHPTNDHGEEFHILAGDEDDFLVRCELRPKKDSSAPVRLDVLVKPHWSAGGASRFLALVRRGYYDGAALNRVVPSFLVQFGIARDAALRDEYAEDAIYDDERKDAKFEPGYVSFAGEWEMIYFSRWAGKRTKNISYPQSRAFRIPGLLLLTPPQAMAPTVGLPKYSS